MTVACFVLLAGTIAGADATAPLGRYTPGQRAHWAFVKPARPAVPAVVGGGEIRNEIDAFVWARLQAEGLQPSPPADRATLVRRVTFDLIGLPPTPSEVDAFVADRASDAYERLVERLLASPHYGERWGQHWLDVVRFAETDGFEYDTLRPDAWRFRDYVVRSFNQDKPYDRFVLEQLAGDEIGPSDEEALIAAGFNRLGPLRKNSGNQAVTSSRNEVLTEMTNVVGSAFLGVTIGCARCHDHKFDPFKQTDYYRLQAYFAATVERNVSRHTAREEAAWKIRAAPVESAMNGLRESLKTASADEKPAIEKRIKELEDQLPPPLPALFSVTDEQGQRPPIFVLKRGEHDRPLARVGMRPLGVFLPDQAPEVAGDLETPRTALAHWISGPDNPLTARVLVNRLWMHHFGAGIVSTPNDFGKNGARPTHPELLDWLAAEMIDGGWSLKAMHRLMVTSNTYRQSSAAGSDAAGAAARLKDPENKLLWRANRRRLEAEEIRDAMLAAAGSLNPKMGGKSVFVPMEQELVRSLYKPSQWQVTPNRAQHHRRSIYLVAKRNLRLPFLQVFDAPDMQASCARRESSTHAAQALELLNGALANAQASALAARVRRQAGADRRKQVALAFRLVTGRAPTHAEQTSTERFLRTNPLGDLALAMWNLNAFLYVN